MGAEERISVTLTEEDAEIVREALISGDFASPEAAVTAALRLWQEQRERDIARLRALVEEGLASGPCEPWEGAEALKKRFRERMQGRDG
jgi:antitoxin ParD1/3/4